MSALRRNASIGPSDEVRAMIDAMPIAAALVDDAGEVLHANEAMRTLAGPAGPLQVSGAHIAQTPAGRCVFALPADAPDPQTQRLASLGFMLASVCHEVSNPLAAVHSMVQFLQSPRGGCPETIEKGLASIAGNIVRVLAITRKLGDFSRVGDDAPQSQSVDAAVRDALGLLRHSRWGGGVEVEYRGEPGAVTRARSGELQQVMLNVMVNAAQAMGGRGRIAIATTLEPDGRIRVQVRDTGPGIPEADLQRVFEPFYSTKAPGEGTGLGLAISFEIVHALGGTLAASNDPRGGACMEIALPRAG